MSAVTLRGILAALALMVPALAVAQTFPAKPVRIVIPFPPGGIADTLCRALGPELTRSWAQPVIVDNRPGANQIIGTDSVAKAPADGYTLLVVDRAAVVLNPYLYSKLPYDAIKDFAPVVNLANIATVLVANRDLPGQSLQELVAWARTRPAGSINYGSLGAGSNPHLDTEALAAQAGIKLTHVPYKGLTEVLPALMAGQIQIAFAGVTFVLPLYKQGRVKVLAVGTPRRSRQLPEVPTFAEAGFPTIESHFWLGMLAPAGTPRPVVERIAADVRAVISQRPFGEKYLAPVGMEVLNQGPDEFGRFLDKERGRYQGYIRSLNVKLA